MSDGGGDSGTGKGGSSGDTKGSGSTSGSTGSFGSSTPGTNADYYFGNPTTPGSGAQNIFSLSSAFGADAGATPGSGNVGGNVNPASWNASLANPSGSSPQGSGAASADAFAPPVGFGTSPTDLTTSFDPFSAGAAPGGAPASFDERFGQTNALTPDQMGANKPTPDATGVSPGGSTGAGGTSTAGSGGKSILDSLGVKNPLGAGIGAAGLAYSLFQGQQAPKFSPELQAQAASLNANGQQLMSYLQSGNLPPGLKASLEQATSAAKTKAISNAAAQGQSTDPTKNTTLAAQLNSIDQQAVISTAQMGQQLMDTGMKETGLSSDLYKTLTQIDQTQTANIGKAIASFASAASGSGAGGINLKLG